MSRATRDSLVGGRNGSFQAGSSLLLQQRRLRSLSACGVTKEEGGDEGLDLFSKNRRSVSIAPGDESDGHNVAVPLNLGRISVGQARLARSGIDELLSAAEMGKHDYDWLLTPPGTPLVSTLDAREAPLPSAASRTNPSTRSTSTTKASRFSAPPPETKHPTRPARSSSVTRPSITTYSSSQLSTSSSRTSLLNTSTASVSSSRPSTPGNRSSSSSITRQSAPTSSRATPSRSSTPAKARPAAPGDKTRSSQGSRPSTPTQRHQVPATSTSITSVASRSSSRPSTPTRRAPVHSPAPATAAPARSPSVGRSARNPGPSSRPSSPGARVRPPPQPLVLPDFPLDAPPNLRTKIPERPASAGRARLGLSLTARSSSNAAEAAPPASSNRRQSVSPVVTRGRLPENSPKLLRLHSDGHEPGTSEAPKPTMPRESAAPKSGKSHLATESTGFGRTISKKSLDMAVRHMDIRQSMGGVRGASLFPQSIRSSAGAAKVTPARLSDPPKSPVSSNGTDPDGKSCNGTIRTGCNGGTSENGDIIGLRSPYVGRASESDIYESSRYDAILLKEDDAKHMNWLHSIEGKPDQSPVFDLRFEPLPEPFVLL